MLVRSTAGAVTVIVAAALAQGCDAGDGRTMRSPTLGERLPLTTTTTTTLPATPPAVTARTTEAAPANGFTLTTPWAPGDTIDPRYTCQGNDVSPALSWTTPPAGTAELALIVTDQSANDTVHWVVAHIPPTAGQQPEAAPFASGNEGLNDLGEIGWTGPCPTPGSLPHTYQFRLVALPEPTELPDPFDADDLFAVPQHQPVVVTESTATYP